MTARDFCFWLQGFFEMRDGANIPAGGLREAGAITSQQADTIREHLWLVFAHEIDPSMGAKAHQATLDHIHQSGPQGGTGAVRPRC